MKKNWINGRGVPIHVLKKVFLVMKLTFILTLLLNMSVWATGFSQENRVSLQMEDVSLEKVILELRKQTEIRFFYSIDKIKTINHLSVNAKDEMLKDVLNRLLEGTGLTYTMLDDVIVIKDKAAVSAADTVRMSKIKGNVKDSKGEPLPGVTVSLKGTTIGVSTNVKGEFELNVPKRDHVVLVFSFVGMKTRELTWKDEKVLNVVLEEDVQAIEEVVITGYGNIDKGNYTGAATTVKGENIIMAGVSSVDQMLQGVVPGMLVINQTGVVGASPKLRVRGTSSLLGSQDPVWVVDGVIQQDPQAFNSDDNTKFSVDADDIKALAGNAISWLNPNDIETITVLKDASATAIYGSKAANGVIVVTTKKATVGKVSLSYSGDFSIGQRPRYGLYDLMNSREFMQFSKEIYEERREYPSDYYIVPIGYQGLLQKMLRKEITLEEMDQEYKYLASRNTDWFKLLFRNSFNHSHSLSISGGSENIQNRTSIGFTQQNGEAKGNGMTSFTATSNTTVKLMESLTIYMRLKGSMREVDGFGFNVDPFSYAYNSSRAIPAYNEDGSLYYHEKRGENSKAIMNKCIYNYNILNELDNTDSKSTTRNWGATIDLKWRLFYGLEYQGLVSYNSSSMDTKQYATERSFYITQYRGYEYGSVSPNSAEAKSTPLPMGGTLTTNLNNTTSITVRNSLVFDRLFQDKHRVTLQLGIETSSVKTKGNSSTRQGYMADRGESFATPPNSYWDHGNSTYTYDNSSYVRGKFSVVNRVNNSLSEYASAVYTYDNRYVLNLSGRVDASNRFGQDKNKRFEPTWSVGLKWRVANERALKNSWWLNTLDLYGSYGYQGNAVSSVSPELIAYNQYLNLIQAYTLRIKSLPYPDLGWEKTKTYNIGVDASFLKERVNFTFNYFRKIGEVLSERDVPYENGVGNGIVSGSTMKNHGYDFVINVVPIRTKDFSWQLSLNTAVTRNSVKQNRVNSLSDYLAGSCVVDNRPYSTFYSYEFGGLNPENGQPTFKNIDQESVTGYTDYLVESGKYTPDFSGGFNTMFKYKRFSLYALFAVQWGGDRRLPALYPAATSLFAGLPGPEQNVSRKLMKRWKEPGDEEKTNIPSLPGIGGEFTMLPRTETVAASKINLYSMYNKSDIRVANTDFIRCRSISLSYDFDKELLKRMHIDRLLLKASMTNPFMWVRDKKWDGLDPETGSWPTRRVTSLSVQVMF